MVIRYKSNMWKLKLFFLLFVTSLTLNAQTKYTEQIQKSEEGQGKLILHQSQKISDLVNGTPKSTVSSVGGIGDNKLVLPGRQASLAGESLSSEQTTNVIGTKMRVNGYRIQVFSGDNSRKGKAQATMMGQRVKSHFMELPVYTQFSSPHWICRVGDFRTYEEASEVFQQLKATGQFEEAVIVRSKVTVYY